MRKDAANTVLEVTDGPGGLEMANEDLRIVNQACTEDALQHERDFAESIITTAQAIVLMLDTEGRIIRFNPYMEESPVDRFENRYVCKNMSYKWLEWRATASDEKGVVYAAATDITECKRAEDELQERMDELETVWLSGNSSCKHFFALPEDLVMVRKIKPQRAQRDTERCYFPLSPTRCPPCPLWFFEPNFENVKKVSGVLVTATRDTRDPTVYGS